MQLPMLVNAAVSFGFFYFPDTVFAGGSLRFPTAEEE